MTLLRRLVVLWLVAVGFAMPAAAAGPACWTDMELMAEAAAEFLLGQEVTARICDPALRTRDKRAERLMTRMHDEVVEKFAINFRKYQEAREQRYRRWYGDDWELQLEQDQKEAFQAFMNDLELGPGVCRNLRSELEIQVDSNWDYIRAKLSHGMKQLRPGKPMCGP